MEKVDLSDRSCATELMDSPSVGYGEMQRCLTDLEKLNIATLGYRPTLYWLDKTIRNKKFNSPLKILDVGCGGGDGLRRIWWWSCKRSIDVELFGIDQSHHACQFAKTKTPANAPITFLTSDIFQYRPEKPVDLIVNTLFTHHLKEQEIVKLLQWMETNATKGWFINDLHRHWMPFYFIRIAATTFRLDPMVCHDAPMSVAKGFSRKDWFRLLEKAGIKSEHVSIQWFFPFRYGVSCKKM